MTPHEFSGKLEEICGDNLESVILYGSAVGSDFSKEFSDYNTIVILKDCSPASLAKLSGLTRKWTKKGNPPPSFFDPNHIKQSIDVFPLEFIDIKARHNVLFGQDPFKDIVVSKANLRHQCESELKGKILNLRAFYTLNSQHPKRISNQMLSSLSSFSCIFRGVIHLIGQTPETGARQTIEQLAKYIDFNPTVFLDLVSVREGLSMPPRRSDAVIMFEKYLTELQTITNFVDRM